MGNFAQNKAWDSFLRAAGLVPLQVSILSFVPLELEREKQVGLFVALSYALRLDLSLRQCLDSSTKWLSDRALCTADF